MVGAVATYRPGEGRFGSAVAVEEGTENRIATPTTFAGWAIGGENAVLDNDGSFYPSQVKFARVRTTSWGFQSNSIPAANGQTWSVSYIARRGTGDGEPRAAIMIMNANNVHASNITPTFSSRNIGGGWVRYEDTFTINREDTGYIRLRFYVTATNGGYHDLALPQLEQKPFATSFVDGTRAAGRLEYPQSIWNHATGTFAAWVKTPTDVTTDRVLTLQWAKDAVGADTWFGIRMDTTGRFVVSYGSANTLTTADSYNDGQWHHIALTWVDGTPDVHLYVDGERVASASEPISVSNPGGRYRGVIPIGHRGWTYNDQWWNGLIDELLILPYAVSEEEIVSWYEAQGPLPPHPQALLQWDRQAVRPAQMVKL